MVKRYLTFIIDMMESLKEFIAKHKVNKEKADDFVIYLSNLIKVVFALELNNHECKYLLKKAGYTLSSANNY